MGFSFQILWPSHNIWNLPLLESIGINYADHSGLPPPWFENVPPGRACMGVLQALARAKGHIIPVSAFMPLLMASWTSILEGLSSPTRVVVVLCVLYIVVEVVLRGTTTICKNVFCRKICILFKKINLFFSLFYFLFDSYCRRKTKKYGRQLKFLSFHIYYQ